MAFDDNTRNKLVKLPTLTRPVGGGITQLTLPKTGLLRGIYLIIDGAVAGTLTVPNALGMSSVVRRTRVNTNSAVDVFSVSGAGYAYLLQEMLGLEVYAYMGGNSGRSAVTATTFTLDEYVPIAMNDRDTIGLYMLQNEQAQVTLTVEWEADATVATGATVTGTAIPYMDILTVPDDPKDFPPLGYVHTIVEDSFVQAGAGDFDYKPQRGNIYLQVGHMAGAGAAGSDLFNRFQVKSAQADTWVDAVPRLLDLEHRRWRGRARPVGTIFQDYLASSGLGNFGTTRDLFDSRLTTDYDHIITATGAVTFTNLRRMLVPLTQS